jgi:hypothetical protein
VEFATSSDLSFVEEWRETLGANPEPKQREAVDLAQLARERLLADSMVGQQYLKTSEDFRDQIARDPQCEVGGFILLRCDWFYDSQIIGSATSGEPGAITSLWIIWRVILSRYDNRRTRDTR